MSELVERLTNEFSDKEYAHAYMREHVNMAIAAQIRTLRELRGLTQAQLAELSDMKQERVSALESVDYDAWTVKTLRKLAEAFDTNLSVSFTPFSKGILDVANISREQLSVPTREADLAQFKRHTILRTGSKWKAIDGSHLAPVTSIQVSGPVKPAQKWQSLNPIKMVAATA